MANTVRSRKAKGRTFQKEVARAIREYFNLQDNDAISTAASVGGEDVILSEFAKRLFPFSVECKKQEKLQIWSAIEQAEKNSKERTPIVVFSRNHAKTYVVIDFESFLALTKYGVGSLGLVDDTR
jgi:hypothetical protein